MHIGINIPNYKYKLCSPFLNNKYICCNIYMCVCVYACVYDNYNRKLYYYIVHIYIYIYILYIVL